MEYAKQLQLRRGTASENTAFTGAEGELIYLTDSKRLALHDGSTRGGFKLPTMEDLNGYVNMDALSDYRSKNTKITVSDLSEDLQQQIITSYDDTELRGLISNLQSSKLNVTEADSKYRLITTKILLQDLDESLNTAIGKISTIETALDGKANSADLSNYRLNSKLIEYNDLSDEVQTKLNSINGMTSDIASLSASVASLGGRVQDLENNGGGSGGGSVVTDGVWTIEEKTQALADITSLQSASANHASISDLSDVADRVTALETNSTSHATTTQLSAVESKADTNTENIASLTTRVSTLETTVEGLTPHEGSGGETTITTEQFNALSNKVSTNEGNITTLSTTYGALNRAVSGTGGLNDRVTTLEADISTATTNANSAKTTAEAAQSSVNELSTRVSTYDTGDHDRITSNTTAIAQLRSDINGNDQEILNINTALGTSGSSDGTTINGKINNLNSAVNTLNGTATEVGSVDYKIANTNHGDLKNLNTNTTRHISQAEYEQLLNLLAMNSQLTQALVDIEELKNGGVSPTPTPASYTDINGNTRNLQYKLLFTTTGNSVNIYNQNTFIDGGYAHLDIEDVFGPNEDYADNRVEVYSYGLSGNPYSVGKYVPYPDQEVPSGVTVDTYFSQADIDPESGLITFVKSGSAANTFLIEIRVYTE